MKLAKILDEIIQQQFKIYNDFGLHEIFDFENKELPPIFEVGSDSYTFNINIDGEEFPIYATISEADPDNFEFPPLLKNLKSVYELGYGFTEDLHSTQFARTDLKFISFVMFVLTNICNKFIQNKKPDIMVFFAESKDGTIRGEQQKLTMYREIVKKHKSSDYVLMDKIRSKSGKMGFIIYRQDVIKNRSKIKP